MSRADIALYIGSLVLCWVASMGRWMDNLYPVWSREFLIVQPMSTRLKCASTKPTRASGSGGETLHQLSLIRARNLSSTRS